MLELFLGLKINKKSETLLSSRNSSNLNIFLIQRLWIMRMEEEDENTFCNPPALAAEKLKLDFSIKDGIHVEM